MRILHLSDLKNIRANLLPCLAPSELTALFPHVKQFSPPDWAAGGQLP